jgi:hypothetical protein
MRSRLSKTGDWDTMTGPVDDEALSTMAIVGEPKTVGAEIVRRFTGWWTGSRCRRPTPSTTTLAHRRRGDQGRELEAAELGSRGPSSRHATPVPLPWAFAGEFG